MNYATLLGLNGINAASLPMLNLVGLGSGINLGSSGLSGLLKTGYDQNGPIYNGPGAKCDQQLFTLLKLENPQRDAIDRAKKYAMEQSIKSALAKQSIQQQIQTGTSKKAQTLALLSRVYVGSISYELKEDAIKQVFIPFGPIRSVSMSWDSVTQKHKGFAFIEYEFPEAAQLAVEQMNNTSLGGRQLKVGRPSNLPKAEPIIEELISEHQLQRKLYVAGVHMDLSEEDLSLVFEAFGKIISCKLNTDPTRLHKHRGFGYIEYETEQAANDAVASMNLFDLGGQFLRVGKAISPPEGVASTPSAAIPAAAAVAAASATAKVMALEAEHVSKGRSPGSGGTSTAATNLIASLGIPGLSNLINFQQSRITSGSNDTTAANRQQGMAEAYDGTVHNVLPSGVDDDDGGTLEHQENFQIRGRDARNVVMQKLIRPPTRGVLILRNMVGPEDCDDTLENEVSEECCKYGPVERVIIYQELDEHGELIIKIFVVFKDADSVDGAINSLHGRYFAGRQVTAEQYSVQLFDANDLTG